MVSFTTRILIGGLGFLGLGFAHWGFEEAINSVIPKIITGVTNKPYTDKIINTWPVIQGEFTVSGILIAIAITLYVLVPSQRN